jgi:hypothetical protein
MNLDKLIFEMYNEVMFSIENNLFEERLSSKESFRRAIALWKNINPAKKEVEAKRILKAAKREGYTIKQKEILAYADEDISSMKAKKSVRRDLRAKKKAKRDERFEQVKASVSDDSNLEDKTRIELLAIAVKKGLKTTPKMNRADLIDLIQPPKKEVKSKKEEKTKLTQEEIIKKYLKTGYNGISQELFNELSMEEVQMYLKTNIQSNDGVLKLYLLKSLPNGVKIPEGCEEINLGNLTSLPKDIKFPKSCKRLDLPSLESLHKDIKFPEKCKYLSLSGLESLPQGIKFPESCESINLYSLESLPEGIKFPESCESIKLANLESLPKDFKFPENTEFIELRNLKKIPKDFKFPEKIDQHLRLDGLQSIEGEIKLPKMIGGNLHLSSLKS